MTYLFDAFYDETLDLIDAGCCSVFIPVHGGLYRAVFAPAGETVRQKMLNDPMGFAVTAICKTREFAEAKGCLMEDE
jgi:hypothetical protein